MTANVGIVSLELAEVTCSDVKTPVGSFHGASNDLYDIFIDLEAAVWIYELRSYGGEQ